ncbi:MAG: hypothetical protein IJ298_02850 [Ruminococcus sp.]|nr:hypothetical protein [Ruminococcus sp.]
MLTYDLHTHILPGVDDGAKTAEDALELISSLKSQGICNICLTPHFYTHHESIEDFLERRTASARNFLPIVPDDVCVKLGAEVYVTKYLFSEERDMTPLCIEGTSFMITEFSYDSTFSDNTMRLITALRDRGITPVIPHVERYPFLLKNKKRLEELIYSGIIIQSNAVSFTQFSTKRKLIKLLKDGCIHVLSSDAHSTNRNSPLAMTAAVEYIKSKCGDDVIRTLQQNAEAIFKGK